jgi:hypothetical protein
LCPDADSAVPYFAEAKNVLTCDPHGRHRLPVTTIIIPDIADAPIDVGEGCPLFPSVGNTPDGC